jgi:hypothetical protein
MRYLLLFAGDQEAFNAMGREDAHAMFGFAIVDVGTLDEALELARSWPAGGSVEIRRVVERG